MCESSKSQMTRQGAGSALLAFTTLCLIAAGAGRRTSDRMSRLGLTRDGLTHLVPRASRSDGSFHAPSGMRASKDPHLARDLTHRPILSTPRFE